jgi:cytoskeletal protein CcmA (bactofilin family)
MATQTLISSTTRVRGSITGAANLTIDGQVEGEIRLDGDLHVNADARIDGDVHADTVVVHGTVKGDLNASVHLTLSKTARVKGALTSPVLHFEDGALVSGKFDIGTAGSSMRKKSKSGPGQASKSSYSASSDEDVGLPEGVIPRRVKVKR